MPTMLIHPSEPSDREMTFEIPDGTFDVMDDDAFFDFCQRNGDVQIERTADGRIEVMQPAGFFTSKSNLDIAKQLGNWADKDGRGLGTDSSGGFFLDNGAERAPDAAWTLRSRLETISPERQQKFLPIAPDFAIELRSPSDRLPKLKEKMAEYVSAGVTLGWLIDPIDRAVHIYSKDAPPRTLENPPEVCGEGLIEGFVLDLEGIF